MAMRPAFRLIAAALARLLGGIAFAAALLHFAVSSLDTDRGRAAVLLSFAGLGAGIFASSRLLLVRATEGRRRSRGSGRLRSSDFFRTSSGLLSASRRNIGS